MTITDSINCELETKVVIVRDGARGWGLSACFVEDALELLDMTAETSPQFALPDEDDEEYTEIVDDMVQELEDLLGIASYSVYWDDGYAIYKDLSEQAEQALFA